MPIHEQLPLCQCGCGKRVTKPQNRFLNTHAQRQIPSETFFWKHVNKTKTCWLWTGAQINKHYGILTFQQKNYLAHRFSWILLHGTIPDDLNVLHNCPEGDNSLCVRPEHLWLGTQAENCADMARKGRHFARTSRALYRLKLNEEAIKVIRFLKGHISQTRLARAYKLHPSHISKIQSGQRWPITMQDYLP